jgi:hypothetical protein
VPAPARIDGVEQQPMHGTSFAYSFSDPGAAERHGQQYFEILGNRGMYKDGWWLSWMMPRTATCPGCVSCCCAASGGVPAAHLGDGRVGGWSAGPAGAPVLGRVVRGRAG